MISFYFQCVAVGVLGILVHSFAKINALRKKSLQNNVAFKAVDYLIEDWVSHTLSFITLLLSVFFIEDFIKYHSKGVDATGFDMLFWIKFSFAFIGYAGNDIASRLFGAVNARINNVIDRKTTIADQVEGVTEPTPHK